jgi:hypothetical protein
MKPLLIAVTLAGAAAVVGPVRAQAPWPTQGQPQWPPPPGYAITYPFASTTPSDAYRQGLINRWELEHYEGPTPQALQGPNPSGRGGSGGGSGG